MVDIAHAVNQGIKEAMMDISKEFNYIAERLSNVLDIDTSQPIEEFKARLANLPKPTD